MTNATKARLEAALLFVPTAVFCMVVGPLIVAFLIWDQFTDGLCVAKQKDILDATEGPVCKVCWHRVSHEYHKSHVSSEARKG